MTAAMVGVLVAAAAAVFAVGIMLGVFPLAEWWLDMFDRITGHDPADRRLPYCTHPAAGVYVQVAGELVCRDVCAPILRSEIRSGQVGGAVR